MSGPRQGSSRRPWKTVARSEGEPFPIMFSAAVADLLGVYLFLCEEVPHV